MTALQQAAMTQTSGVFGVIKNRERAESEKGSIVDEPKEDEIVYAKPTDPMFNPKSVNEDDDVQVYKVQIATNEKFWN